MFLGVRLAAACLLAAAAGVVPWSSAEASTCSSAGGVSVVVDFHELGGGVQTACIADGGGKVASTLFPAAGYALTYAQRQPGFVCRVGGAPASDPCVNTSPADAYWGLWWSDGESGQWTYATRGAGSQSIPDGGYVAFSWNGSASRSAPGVSPATHPTAPTPTSKPSTKPSARPTHQAGSTPTKKPSSAISSTSSATSSASASASPSSSTQASGKPSGKAGHPTKSPGGVDGEMLPESTSASPSPLTSTAADPAEPADGGLPTWVGPVVVVGLFAAGGAVAVVRRRRNPSP